MLNRLRVTTFMVLGILALVFLITGIGVGQEYYVIDPDEAFEVEPGFPGWDYMVPEPGPPPEFENPPFLAWPQAPIMIIPPSSAPSGDHYKPYHNPVRPQSNHESEDSANSQFSHETLWVQNRLNALEFKAGAEDGIMGRVTREALRRFQRDQQLAATGALDKETIKALSKGQNFEGPPTPINDREKFSYLGPIGTSSSGKNLLTIDNQTSSGALIKAVGPTLKTFYVKAWSKGSVHIAPGRYIIKFRTGEGSAVACSQGDEFDVLTNYDRIVTVHTVKDGNYKKSNIEVNEF